MAKDSGGDQDELRLVDEEGEVEEVLKLVKEEEEVVTLGKSPETRAVNLRPLRPTKPVMRPLDEKDVSSFESHKKAADLNANWEHHPDELPKAGELSPSSGKIPIGWTVMPVVFMVGIGLLVGWWNLGNDTDSRITVSNPKDSGTGETSVTERVAQKEKERRAAADYYEELEEKLTRYFSAEKLEDFSGIIRQEERVMPILRKHYAENSFDPREFQSIAEFRPVAAENRAMIGMQVNFKDGTIKYALAEDTAEGIRIDWESEQSYQTMPVEDFIFLKIKEPTVFRVYAEPDNFFAYEFADEKKYLSLKITFRDSENYLNGFIRKGTKLEAEFRQLMDDRGYHRSPMMLKVAFPPEGKADRSVEVVELVSKIWAVID